jgi:hypothetical protein
VCGPFSKLCLKGAISSISGTKASVSGLKKVLASFGMSFHGLNRFVSEIAYNMATGHSAHCTSSSRSTMSPIASHKLSCFRSHMGVIDVHLILSKRVLSLVSIENRLRDALHGSRNELG